MHDKPIEEFSGTKRFTIQRKLGSGGCGVVYQAYDSELNNVVALKTLNNILRAESNSAVYRFKKEFRALTDLIHPNLVALYELIANGDHLFFTMELVHGVDFLDYVYGGKPASDMPDSSSDNNVAGDDIFNMPTFTPATSSSIDQAAVSGASISSARRRLDFDRLRSALKQATEGICALHNAGKLHRDIKPSNIMVTRDDRVVILDFGMVTELTRKEESFDIVGTPSYMSPEQSFGEAVSAASDWYSVGVMLYEALTGRLPFEGKMMELFMKKRSQDAIPPIELVSNIPQDLNNLCMDLLMRDAAKRPTGMEILRRLGGNRTQSLTGRISLILSRPSELVGRRQHLKILQDAYNIAKKGRAIIVNVHGSSGMGKSSLVNYFLDKLEQSNQEVVILLGRCYEQESLPYKAFDGIIDALSRYLKSLTEVEVARLLPRDGFALLRLFPVLHQVLEVSSRWQRNIEIPDSQELRRRAFSALKELFSRLTDKIPVVLFIDDLQWGDIDSAMLLHELLSPPDPPALLLIASYRSEDAKTNPLLASLSDLKIERRELVVQKLSMEESQLLVLKLLDGEQAEVAAQAELIAQEAGGSPFFIDELVRYMRSSSAPIKALNKSVGNDENNGPQTFTANLDKMLAKRFSALPASARQLLETIVVAGQPISRATAKQVAQLEAEEQSAISYLRTRHLIRVIDINNQTELETYHDRIREAISAHLPKETLKQLHYRLGLELEKIEGIEPERLANHFHRGEIFDKAATYMIAAAEKAYNTLAFDNAAAMYKLALELLPPEMAQASSSLRAQLAKSLVNAGRSSQAAQAYILAANESKDAVNIIELESRAAEQLLLSGHIDEAYAMLRKVLTKFDSKLAETPRQALFSLFYNRLKIRLRGRKFRESNAANLSAEDLIKLDTFWSVAMGLSMVDTIRGVDFHARHQLLALKLGDSMRVARAFCGEIIYSSLGGIRTQARTEEYIRATDQLLQTVDNANIQALGLVAKGNAAFLEGRFRASVDLLNRADHLMREQCYGALWEFDTSRVFLLRALIMLGELAETARRLPDLLKLAQERGDLYAEISLRTRISYMTLLAQDEPAQAREELAQSIARWSNQSFHVQHYFALIGNVEIELYCGNYANAWKLLNEKWPAVTRSLLLRVQFLNIEAIFWRGSVAIAHALAMSDSAAAPFIKQAENAVKALKKEATPWANALALLLRACIDSRQSNMAARLKLLATAESELAANEMMLYAMAARRRRGDLLLDASLIKESDDWMRGQMIANPEQMTIMLTPGLKMTL